MGDKRKFLSVPKKPRTVAELLVGAFLLGACSALLIQNIFFPQVMEKQTRELSPPTPSIVIRGMGLIPMERENGVLVVRGTVNDTLEGKFLIDTGAAYTYLSTSFAKKLGLDWKKGASETVSTIVGLSVAGIAVLKSFQIGNTGTINMPIRVHNIPWGADGIIGLDFLGNYRLDMNPDTMLLGLKPAKVPLGAQTD